MKECECLKGCPFFNDKMSDTDGLGAMYKQKYCLGDNLGCARYQIFTRLGKEYVPMDLFPNMNERAKTIISRSTNKDAIPSRDLINDVIRNMFSPIGTRK